VPGRTVRARHRVDAWQSFSYKPPVTLQIAACPNHPTREAIGICVRCRARLCSECATKVDGINYCVACLDVLAARGARAPVQRSGRLRTYLAAFAYLLTLSLLAWGVLEVAFPQGPR
jgi:hypothetical protein